MNYLALGDSITAGVGAPKGKGYVELLYHRLTPYYHPHYLWKICRKGWPTKQLLSAVTQHPYQRFLLPQTNLITLYIGGNDLNVAYLKYKLSGKMASLDEGLEHFVKHYQQLLQTLRSVSSATILGATVYNPFPLEPLAEEYIRHLNHIILGISETWLIPVVNVASLFAGKESQYIEGYQDGQFHRLIPFLQKNPIHPNEQGHQAIADAFFDTLQTLTIHTKNKSQHTFC